MTNSDTQTNQKSNVKVILSLLLGIALVFFIVNVTVDKRLTKFQFETKLLISEQETLLVSIAEITARNGADEVTERIIRDCSLSERSSFDQLLSSLDKGLSRVELTELERLFGRCGNFFPERKSVMVSRFQREIEVYKILVEQLNSLSDKDNSVDYKVEEWKSLVALETKQSKSFTELAAVQDEIITLLLNGKLPESEEVRDTLRRASEIQETLIVTDSQASKIRSSLVSL